PRRVAGGQGGRPEGGPSAASLSLTPGQPPPPSEQRPGPAQPLRSLSATSARERCQNEAGPGEHPLPAEPPVPGGGGRRSRRRRRGGPSAARLGLDTRPATPSSLQRPGSARPLAKPTGPPARNQHARPQRQATAPRRVTHTRR